MKKASNEHIARPGWLFSFVYNGFFVRRLIFLLLLSFLLQPIHRSYADELPESPSESAVAPAEPIESVSTDIPVPPQGEGVAAESASKMNVEVENISGEDQSDSPLTTEDTSTATGQENETTASATNSANGVAPSGSFEVATDTPDTVIQEAEADSDMFEPEALFDESTTTLASSTVEDETILPLVSESFSDSEVRFKKDDCVQVDDGSYYCQPSAVGTMVRDAVVSAPDEEGDLEIYLVKDGVYTQLTDNQVDDSAPFYDGKSETMVWHQLVNDRYQIWSFNFKTGESSQLTDGSFNDMEPVRYDDVTVWQRWINDVWQIMLLREGDLTQLTEGTSHHLTPSVYDGLVLWRTVEGSGIKVLESYDLKTGNHSVIDDPDEAAMVNPRMVMVYEAVYGNGDRVTRGVDIATGKIIALAALPTELPDNLPPTDTTGETRALIQIKPAAKEGVELETGEPLPALDPPLPPDPFTLVISSSSVEVMAELVPESTTTVSASVSPQVDTASGFDLVIPAATSTQSGQ